jgi:hypothetical protein
MDFALVKREDVLLAIQQFDNGQKLDGFRDSTTYDLINQGRAYPPKLLMALAFKNVSGRQYL